MEESKFGVSVVRSDGGSHVIAAVPFAARQTILRFEGKRTAGPSRHSIQLGEDLHIDAPENPPAADAPLYSWQYLNHSCDPNAHVQGLELVALRHIPAGEEVTFDYNTTELDMASPFDCHCGSPLCRRRIRGFRYLEPRDQERLRPYLSPHLARLLPEPAVAAAVLL